MDNETHESPLWKAHDDYVAKYGKPPRNATQFRAWCKQNGIGASYNQCAVFLGQTQIPERWKPLAQKLRPSVQRSSSLHEEQKNLEQTAKQIERSSTLISVAKPQVEPPTKSLETTLEEPLPVTVSVIPPVQSQGLPAPSPVSGLPVPPPARGLPMPPPVPAPLQSEDKPSHQLDVQSIAFPRSVSEGGLPQLVGLPPPEYADSSDEEELEEKEEDSFGAKFKKAISDYKPVVIGNRVSLSAMDQPSNQWAKLRERKRHSLNDNHDAKSHEFDQIFARHMSLDVRGLQLEEMEVFRQSFLNSSDESINLEESDTLREAKKLKKRREYIESEIVNTEKVYVEGLKTLLFDLIAPIFKNRWVEAEYHSLVPLSIFYCKIDSNLHAPEYTSPFLYTDFHSQCLMFLHKTDIIHSSIPEILSFHETFYAELQEVHFTKERPLASVFNAMAKSRDNFVDIYHRFVGDYNKILDLLGSQFHDNTKLQTFLSEMRSKGKDLSDYMVRPIQRCPRYILLLQNLRENTEPESREYDIIEKVLAVIADIAAEINERQAQLENTLQCLQIQQSLKGLKISIVDEERTYCGEEFMFIKAAIGHSRRFFVFNDIMVVANEDWKVKHILDILTVEIKTADEERGRAKFELIAPEIKSIRYIAKNWETIKRFRDIVVKWRIGRFNEANAPKRLSSNSQYLRTPSEPRKRAHTR